MSSFASFSSKAEEIQTELQKRKQEIMFSFLKNEFCLATVQNQQKGIGLDDVVEALNWNRNSFKSYTQLVEEKLLKIVFNCLKHQQEFEIKLQDSANEIKRLQEENDKLSRQNAEDSASRGEISTENLSEFFSFSVDNWSLECIPDLEKSENDTKITLSDMKDQDGFKSSESQFQNCAKQSEIISATYPNKLQEIKNDTTVNSEHQKMDEALNNSVNSPKCDVLAEEAVAINASLKNRKRMRSSEDDSESDELLDSWKLSRIDDGEFQSLNEVQDTHMIIEAQKDDINELQNRHDLRKNKLVNYSMSDSDNESDLLNCTEEAKESGDKTENDDDECLSVMQRKFNRGSTKTQYDKFLDAELIRELLYAYLSDLGISKTQFAQHVLQQSGSLFSTTLAEFSFWQTRTNNAKKLFHKLKWIINQVPRTENMLIVERGIYKQRMKVLINLMQSLQCTHKSFARHQLQISLSEFKELQTTIFEDKPINKNTRKLMNKISELISLKNLKLKKICEKYERPIKDKEGLQNLLNSLTEKLAVDNMPMNCFCEHVLNAPKSTLLKYINFQKRKIKRLSVTYINAIYNWLNDEDRMQKFIKAKETGEFYYLNFRGIIDNDVLKFFDM